jgi:uncharacterized membrane protein YeaQ/YmgE (transglycosylase-associated protein family)
MGILAWIIVGLVAGAIAKALHPGKDPGGFIVTILIGIAGARSGRLDIFSFWIWNRRRLQFGESFYSYFRRCVTAVFI